MENYIKQIPTPPNEWVYKDDGDDRMFRIEVMLPIGVPAWAECTNAEKEQWEKDHPQPEYEQEA